MEEEMLASQLFSKGLLSELMIMEESKRIENNKRSSANLTLPLLLL